MRMKKFFLLLLSISVISSSLVFAGNRLIVEEEYAEFINVEPQVVNGLFYVPLREMAENMGYTVQWREKSKEAVVLGGNKEVVFNTKNDIYIVNGTAKQMSEDIAVLNDYTLIPLDLWGEIYNKYVYWDSINSVGVAVTPADITMDEYLAVVEYCGKVTLFNNVYNNIKAEATSLIDTYSKTKNTALLQEIKSDAQMDLSDLLEQIECMEMPGFALKYKKATFELCKTKYDYIEYYLDNADKDRTFNEPVEEYRDEIIKQNLIVTAQLKGFFNKAAVIDESNPYIEEVKAFSDEISQINEEMFNCLYHIDTENDNLNEELVKYGEAIKIYAREYKIRLKQVQDTVFSDDTFEDNVKAIGFILDSISDVGDTYIKCGNGECSLERANLQSSYIDFVWENIYMFVIAEHFGFSFDYIENTQINGVQA